MASEELGLQSDLLIEDAFLCVADFKDLKYLCLCMVESRALLPKSLAKSNNSLTVWTNRAGQDLMHHNAGPLSCHMKWNSMVKPVTLALTSENIKAIKDTSMDFYTHSAKYVSNTPSSNERFSEQATETGMSPLT
ncbi:hypothetical protein EJB05_13957 [Eragrostis curvula]|uniref:Uncharacterized protein n=1 Tax=Eragrostis curvula TaxID=38414 RepID=A0A5J9VZG0_9POAL|nr:hypothetical protein EJB05_13957 [Eragrostis curvula]